MTSLVPTERIEKAILLIRGQKVLLDSTLSKFYGETTKRVNQQVSRNLKRFPPDFMFQLTPLEYESLRLHFATSKLGRGGRRYMPYVFTEQGVAMLSSVLNTERAIEVNIQIMRAFVRLRRLVSSHRVLAKKLGELERKVGSHDKAINSLFEVIYKMMNPAVEKKRFIGFKRSPD